MTLIAQDLKDVLEEQFAGCRGQSATATRLMLPAAHVAMACAQTDDASLAGGDTDAAEAAFERAGIIEHAADAEMGLVRACMQPGRYRRALTFVAHTAGVHPTDPRVALDGIYETAMRVALQVLAAR